MATCREFGGLTIEVLGEIFVYGKRYVDLRRVWIFRFRILQCCIAFCVNAFGLRLKCIEKLIFRVRFECNSQIYN